MSKEYEFNISKSALKQSLADFIEMINTFEFQDLNDRNKRKLLIEAAIKAVEANTSFSLFLVPQNERSAS